MDPDIARWVVEFLLRQRLEDRVLKSLLLSVPISNDNFCVKKLILLSKLESDVSRRSISESTLEVLEQLEELKFQASEEASDSMKRCYCAVAVECTVKILGNEDDCSRFDFFEAVKRVWRGKVERMEKGVENGGLCSEELRVWKDEVEAAVLDDGVCEKVVKRSVYINAVEAVKGYLREERDKIGPSFLESVAANLKDVEVVQGMLGISSQVERVAGKEEASGTQKEKVHLRNKLVGLKRTKRLSSRNPKRVKIVDSDEDTTEPSNSNNNLPHITEKSSDGHKNSMMERKPSAQAYQWDDSIDGSVEDQADRWGKHQSPRPRLVNVPPRKNKNSRRAARKWSLSEEDALRTGVEEYGKGNWKLILRAFHDAFEERTEVDLKDKWRNMTR